MPDGQLPQYVADVTTLKLQMALYPIKRIPVKSSTKVKWTAEQRKLATQALQPIDMDILQNMVGLSFRFSSLLLCIVLINLH